MEGPAYRIDERPATAAAFYAAACDPQRSVVVEACAGAGKTWMLVSRVLRALLAGAEPHQILAITFTRKAAGEMRARLDEWLAGFSNEAGVDGTIRFLRNGTGLWLLQRCRAAWGSPPYADLVAAAGTAPAFRSLIDPDAPCLIAPDDMPARLAELCRAHAEPVPADRAAMVRCVLDSLACKHRWTLERAEALAGSRAEVVHIVGGGAANPLLCQLTADLTGRLVLAGPVEATAIGNLLVQARAAGELSSLAEVREVVRASLPPRRFEPRSSDLTDAAYSRFLTLLDSDDRI